MLKLVFDTNFSLIFATIPAQKANAKYKFKSANKGATKAKSMMILRHRVKRTSDETLKAL